MVLGDFIHEFDRRTDPSPISEVVLNTREDLPKTKNGVIKLVDFKHYIVGQDFSFDDPIIVGENNFWSSVSGLGPIATYTGTDVMFTGVDKTFQIFNASISCPNASQVFDFRDVVSPQTHAFIFQNFTIGSCKKVGTFNDLFRMIFILGSSRDVTDGITLVGNIISIVDITEYIIESVEATFVGLELGSVSLPNLEIKSFRPIAITTGAIGLRGLDVSRNIPEFSRCRVTTCEFIDCDIPLSGITNSDVQWEFQGNSGIDDSSKSVVSSLSSSEVVTVGVLNQNVWLNIAGTNWASSVAERFTTTITGLLTYIGMPTIKCRVCITATVEKSGGGTDEIDLGISFNGADPSVGNINSTENKTPTSVTSKDLFVVSTGDTFQAMVRNADGISNIIVIRANIDAINGI